MIRLEYKLPGGEWVSYGDYDADKRNIAERRAADLAFRVPGVETRIVEGE